MIFEILDLGHRDVDLMHQLINRVSVCAAVWCAMVWVGCDMLRVVNGRCNAMGSKRDVMLYCDFAM